MINRLFSSFDPIGRYLNLNYIILAAIPLFILIFNGLTRTRKLIDLCSNNLKIEISAARNNTNIKGKTSILACFFFILLILNLFGLLPYIYTITAQLLFAIRLRLPLWLGFMLFSISINTKHIISHLVPVSTPIFLSQFIVLIERVRQLIRPITLSVRLAANLTAGHILIALLRNTITIINPVVIILLVLILLELAVALIQAYVFTILLSIYIVEAYDKTISPLSYCVR